MLINLFGLEIKMKKEAFVIILIGFIIFVGMIGFYISKENNQIIIDAYDETSEKISEDKVLSSKNSGFKSGYSVKNGNTENTSSENTDRTNPVKNVEQSGNSKEVLISEGFVTISGSKSVPEPESKSVSEPEPNGNSQGRSESLPNQENNNSLENKDKVMIKVYITGCVKKPGIYELEKGSLLNDAVRVAGGFSEKADPSEVNLIYSIEENMMIKILPKVSNDTNNGILSYKDNESSSAMKVVAGNTYGNNSRNVSGNMSANVEPVPVNRININTAGVQELDSIPGIGVSTANDIISYRQKNGNFKRKEDIMKINGIKENRYNSIEKYIDVKD